MSDLLRFGTISEVQGDKARVKLAEKLVTDFLPVLQFANSYKQKWEPIRPGEQCFVLPNLGDINSGLIIRGVYFDKLPAPGTSDKEEITIYEDGTSISYNTESKTLTVSLAKDATIGITGDANITVGGALNVTAQTANVEATKATVTAETEHKGNITVDGIITATGVIGTTVTVGGASGAKLSASGGEFTIDRKLKVEGELNTNGSIKSSGTVSDAQGNLRNSTGGGGG
jgi:phage baseplate assembly protein V